MLHEKLEVHSDLIMVNATKTVDGFQAFIRILDEEIMKMTANWFVNKKNDG